MIYAAGVCAYTAYSFAVWRLRFVFFFSAGFGFAFATLKNDPGPVSSISCSTGGAAAARVRRGVTGSDIETVERTPRRGGKAGIRSMAGKDARRVLSRTDAARAASQMN